MRIAIGQINSTVGDLAGNSRKILEYAERARAAGAGLLLTPELSLCGYPPEDLLLRQDFRAACERALGELAAQVRGIDVIVGHPESSGGRLFNAASLLRDGRIAVTYRKHDLPNYTVFDEERYFEPANEACVVEVGGVHMGINICEDVWGAGGESIARVSTDAQGVAVGVSVGADAWRPEAPLMARAGGAAILLVLNASPFHIGKQKTRYDVVRERTAETGMAVVFCNLVGGQDELVFDGASFVMDSRGRLTHLLPAFEEHLALVDFQGEQPVPGKLAPELQADASMYRALCLGVRDYLAKNRFPGALLGLSGGIDSALTLCIAADALGAENVHAVMMPSQFTADMSIDDSREMVRLLGVRYSEIAIKPMFDAYMEALAAQFGDRPFDATEENLQSRIRGTLLMALSNKFGSIVLTTGNKSEMSTGYATLYGDMAGGFAVLKDLTKKHVYGLARYRNSLSAAIPERVITRPPSAELRPDQLDQDSLPPYEALDAIVELYVEEDRSIAQIVAAGYRREDVEKIVRLVHINEYKRRQAPVGIRVTRRGFGKDWRYPITNKYRGGL
jgi:NAD+ synthase (glutamine-hydrolysing)